jgi:hypothetical protein
LKAAIPIDLNPCLIAAARHSGKRPLLYSSLVKSGLEPRTRFYDRFGTLASVGVGAQSRNTRNVERKNRERILERLIYRLGYDMSIAVWMG